MSSKNTNKPSEMISKTFSRLIKQMGNTNTSTQTEIENILSEIDSKSLRIVKGVLDPAITLSEKREEAVKSAEEERLKSEEELRADLLEILKESPAYKLATSIGEIKSPEDMLASLFSPKKSNPKKQNRSNNQRANKPGTGNTNNSSNVNSLSHNGN